jgi:hypothetical protein
MLLVVVEQEMVVGVVMVLELGDEAVENYLKQVEEYLLEIKTDLMKGM